MWLDYECSALELPCHVSRSIIQILNQGFPYRSEVGTRGPLKLGKNMCYCKSSVALPHGAVGWSAVYDCGIS